MLYVKVDANGNPVEAAKNYRMIKDEHSLKNTSIPEETTFFSNLKFFGYAPVDFSEPPVPEQGKKPVPGVPTKNDDGTMTRTWEMVPVELHEIESVSSMMRIKRNDLLARYIDTISPLRWESWSEEEKAEISAWRNELLSITEKEGFPFISFPLIPQLLK